jgi:hypothetical protein
VIRQLAKMMFNLKIKHSQYPIPHLWKYYWCKQCRFLLRWSICLNCEYKSLVPSNFSKIKGHLLLLKGSSFGLHRMVRESKACYYIYDKKINREVGFIKSKWYVIKLW